MSFLPDGFVSEGWFSRKPSLSNLFFLTLADFFGEVGDEFLCENNFNIPPELLIGLGVFVNNKILFHEVDTSRFVTFYPFVCCHSFFEVASENEKSK